MSGVAVIRHLLANNSALIAVVPAAKIKAGVIPINTVLPAISVTQISGVDRLAVDTRTVRLVTDRVQVTVMTKDYPSQKSILALVRTACQSTRGTVNGVAVDSIAPDTTGPDIYDSEDLVYFQSRDFLVRYTQ